jgi:hypothetical protein
MGNGNGEPNHLNHSLRTQEWEWEMGVGNGNEGKLNHLNQTL